MIIVLIRRGKGKFNSFGKMFPTGEKRERREFISVARNVFGLFAIVCNALIDEGLIGQHGGVEIREGRKPRRKRENK